jgi:hypothetical protein
MIAPLVTTAAYGNLGIPGLNGTAMFTPSFPRLVVDPRSGWAVAVWNDKSADGDPADIYGSVSKDGGKTWSSRLKLNHDTSKTAQFLPAVEFYDSSYDRSVKAFGLVYYGRGVNSPTSNVALFKTACTVDGTITCGPDVQVTSAFQVANGQGAGNSADYWTTSNALECKRDTCYAAFTGTGGNVQLAKIPSFYGLRGDFHNIVPQTAKDDATSMWRKNPIPDD